jgi:protein-S-isoprenylcysteine O-methyltransferase Ste14
MEAGTVVADGPYRYVRNPLYLGSWLMVLAMAFLMAPRGAAFAVVLASLFLLRPIFAEEAFLGANLGEPYLAYRRAVPRLIPRLPTTIPKAAAKQHWLRALVMELNSIGVFLTLAVLSWSNDHTLMIKALLISVGVSLVARALMLRD